MTPKTLNSLIVALTQAANSNTDATKKMFKAVNHLVEEFQMFRNTKDSLVDVVQEASLALSEIPDILNYVRTTYDQVGMSLNDINEIFRKINFSKAQAKIANRSNDIEHILIIDYEIFECLAMALTFKGRRKDTIIRDIKNYIYEENIRVEGKLHDDFVNNRDGKMDWIVKILDMCKNKYALTDKQVDILIGMFIVSIALSEDKSIHMTSIMDELYIE